MFIPIAIYYIIIKNIGTIYMKRWLFTLLIPSLTFAQIPYRANDPKTCEALIEIYDITNKLYQQNISMDTVIRYTNANFEGTPIALSAIIYTIRKNYEYNKQQIPIELGKEMVFDQCMHNYE